MRIAVAVLLLAVSAALAQDWHYWENQGIKAFKTHDYQAAVPAFQKAAELQPDQKEPHLYLGTIWMSEWIPAAATPENAELARNAESEFQRVLAMAPNDLTALSSLARLSFLQSER